MQRQILRAVNLQLQIDKLKAEQSEVFAQMSNSTVLHDYDGHLVASIGGTMYKINLHIIDYAGDLKITGVEVEPATLIE